MGQRKRLSPDRKINHLFLLITTHNDFDSADTSNLLSMCSCTYSSVDRVPTWCSGGSCWAFIFFFVPCPCHVYQFAFHISLQSLKFTIFIHLSKHNNILQNIYALHTEGFWFQSPPPPLSHSSLKFHFGFFFFP